MERNKIYIYGKHAVIEALEYAPDTVNRVFIAPDVKDTDLQELIQKSGVSVGRLKSRTETRGKSGTAHQGVFASISLHNLVQPMGAFLDALTPDADTSLVYLDELTDPHNVGAIIRSAAALGVSGVLMPQKGQAPITGAVVKVSSGMVFRVPIVAVDDPYQALAALKERGFTLYGLSGEEKRSVSEPVFDSPSVFVLGNESRGLSKSTAKACDEFLTIPIHGRAESLNVAAATAITLFAWSVRHPGALK